MIKHKPQLTYAYNQDGLLVHVDSVENGSACGCICPECKQPLIAKNYGNVRIHHFSHESGTICESACESVFHILAKQILEEEGGIMFPPIADSRYPQGFTKLRDIKVEQYDPKLNIIPDAEGILPNGERVLIEFYYTHKVPTEKKEAILDSNLKCLEIEINLPDLTLENLRSFLVDSEDNRHWLTYDDLPEPSYYHERNPIYDHCIDYLAERFEKDALQVKMQKVDYSTVIYNLRELGYDTCQIDQDIEGFHTDLLLQRSGKTGDIGICIRGRHRTEDKIKMIPTGLKLIDIIIINKDLKPEVFWKTGIIEDSYAAKVIFYNFKGILCNSKPLISRKRPHKTFTQWRPPF